MRRVVLSLAVFSAVLYGQTAETAFFRVVLLPSLEVPAVNSTTRGVVDIAAGVVRDSSGQIVSGTVTFLARVTFAAAATATGLDIHSGSTGQNGPVVISTGLSPSNSHAIQSGGDIVNLPAQITGDDANALNALRSLFQDPTKFYVNLLTTDQPNGAVRGQLQRAQSVVLMGLMTSDNVTTAPTSFARGVAQVVAIGTADASGNWTSAEVYLSATYFSLDPTAFTGFHIHPGLPGTAGPIAITGTLPAGMAPDPSGAATIGPLYAEVTLTNATQAGALVNLFNNPGGVYIDLHTSANPNGIVRAQLRPTDSMAFPVVMNSANEVTAPSVPATAPSTLTLNTLRNADGSIAAGTILADVDYRFPGPAQFLGLYIRNGQAQQDGPVAIKVAPDFHADSGFGNYYGWSGPVADLSALEDLVETPANHYVSLHSLNDPAGAARAQLQPPNTAAASVAAVIAANLDKNATTVAPGGLISIFGANLAKVATDLKGWTGQTLPAGLNGVSVRIGGKPAPILYVSPSQINAQVPVDVAPGTQPLTVNDSAAFPVTVAAAAPAIFFYPVPSILKNANYSLVSTTNPAHAGDVILVYATGLGQTNPPMATGAVVPVGTVAQTAPVAVSIGGKNAVVAYSIESPQFAGLYQVAVTVPSGLSGSVPLLIQQAGATSNTVNLAVQ